MAIDLGLPEFPISQVSDGLVVEDLIHIYKALQLLGAQVGTSAVLKGSGTSSVVSDTLAKTTLASLLIPAHSISSNDSLRISGVFSYTSSANSKSFGIDLGTQNLVTFTETTSSYRGFTVTLRAKNSLSSQIVQSSSDSFGSSITNTTVDLSMDQTLTLWGQLTNTGETINLVAYTVEQLRGS